MKPFFQSFPSFKGKLRLAKLFYYNKIKSASDISVTGKYATNYLLPNLHENLAFEIFVNGIYEQDTFNILDRFIPYNGTFLDLGANIGAISIPFCRKRSDVFCIAVEAAPWIYDYLCANIISNNLESNIKSVNKALHFQDNQDFNFYTDRNYFGKGSLSPIFSQIPISVKSISVDTLLTEMHISHVDFIKIDIEGFEYFAFSGAVNLLSSPSSPDIYFEFADWAEVNAGLKAGEAQQYLASLGYKLYIVENSNTFTRIENPLPAGNFMLYATKKQNFEIRR